MARYKIKALDNSIHLMYAIYMMIDIYQGLNLGSPKIEGSALPNHLPHRIVLFKELNLSFLY